jgi:hypothetical protein
MECSAILLVMPPLTTDLAAPTPVFSSASSPHRLPEDAG